MTNNQAFVPNTIAFYPYSASDIENVQKLLKVISYMSGEDITDFEITCAKDIELVLKCAEEMLVSIKGY